MFVRDGGADTVATNLASTGDGWVLNGAGNCGSGGMGDFFGNLRSSFVLEVGLIGDTGIVLAIVSDSGAVTEGKLFWLRCGVDGVVGLGGVGVSISIGADNSDSSYSDDSGDGSDENFANSVFHKQIPISCLYYSTYCS